jgi:hypothetical protein
MATNQYGRCLQKKKKHWRVHAQRDNLVKVQREEGYLQAKDPQEEQDLLTPLSCTSNLQNLRK